MAGKPYKFGNKVNMAVTSWGEWLVGAKSFTSNLYDGHTLAAQMKQVKDTIRDRACEVHVDMGYRGHDYVGQSRSMWTNEEEVERRGCSGAG